MRQENVIGDRINIVLVCSLVIFFFLALTWSAAYGFNVNQVPPTNSDQGNPDEDMLMSKHQELPTDSPQDMFNEDGTSDYSEFVVTDDGQGTDPVPEPATLILLGLGIAGSAAYRRIRH